METLVKTLNASVSPDIEKLGVIQAQIHNPHDYAEAFQLYTADSITLKCISGTIYTSNTLATVELSAGQSKTYTGSNYFYLAGDADLKLEIENAYEIGLFGSAWLSFIPFLLIDNLAKYIKLFSLYFKETTFTGHLENYVEKAALYGKSVDLTIVNSWVYFNKGASEIHGTKYFCDFSSDNNIVTIKDTDASGSVLGTYNKSTGVWTYA